MEVKIISGFSGPGGSTIALASLVNILNEGGINAMFYSKLPLWEGMTCKNDKVDNCKIFKHDSLVLHFFPIKEKLDVKNQIISCHETVVFPMKSLNLAYDKVHYVSDFQKTWHGIEGTVIPNSIRRFKPKKKSKKVVGILGSIDLNKRTDTSIRNALQAGHTDIRIYGAVTDPAYFQYAVAPLLSDNVTYRGVANDMQRVYDQVTHVFHSPLLETFNLVKAECKFAEVTYVGNEGNDTKAEYWDDSRIFEAWKKLLST